MFKFLGVFSKFFASSGSNDKLGSVLNQPRKSLIAEIVILCLSARLPKNIFACLWCSLVLLTFKTTQLLLNGDEIGGDIGILAKSELEMKSKTFT